MEAQITGVPYFQSNALHYYATGNDAQVGEYNRSSARYNEDLSETTAAKQT